MFWSPQVRRSSRVGCGPRRGSQAPAPGPRHESSVSGQVLTRGAWVWAGRCQPGCPARRLSPKHSDVGDGLREANAWFWDPGLGRGRRRALRGHQRGAGPRPPLRTQTGKDPRRGAGRGTWRLPRNLPGADSRGGPAVDAAPEPQRPGGSACSARGRGRWAGSRNPRDMSSSWPPSGLCTPGPPESPAAAFGRAGHRGQCTDHPLPRFPEGP